MPYTTGGSLLTTEGQGTNVLDKFQTFNCLFTLAALTQNQVNGHSINRSAIQNIICRSQSIGPSGGVGTSFGKYDYFIDDVLISAIPALTKKTGNSFATKVTFKVYEPYSMGLFMLTMQQAAKEAGYGQSFKEAPYLLMIEFVGYVDGQPGSPEPGTELVRYIPIKIIDIKFNVGITGSTYLVTAIPYNEHAFREQTVRTVSDIKIAGETVAQLLLKGVGEGSEQRPETSLLGALQERKDIERKAGRLNNDDEYYIHFPTDYQDVPGTENEISDAKVYTDFSNAGTQIFPELQEIFDSNKHIYKSPKFKLEKNRVWHFVQECTIPEIITEVILRSEYIQNQVLTELNQQGQQTFKSFKVDSNGMIKWFRIETHVRDKDFNAQLGRQQREYHYRVLVYKVHVHRFLPPGETSPGLQTLKNSVARVYDYIYTGKNTEILDFQINFDLAFFTPVPFDASENVGQNNPSQAGIDAGGVPLFYKFTQGQGIGNLAELTTANVQAAQRQYHSKGMGGSGNDNEKTSQIRTMQALLTNKGDMVNLNMDIMGDPYYIPSTGMGNLIVPSSGFGITNEGSMNYQSNELYIQINFRTPIDLDPETGLYKFEKGIDIWSGLYQVTGIESKFNGGKFTQTLTGFRLRAQLGGKDGQQGVFLEPRKNSQENQGGTPGGGQYGAGVLNPDTGGKTGGSGGGTRGSSGGGSSGGSGRDSSGRYGGGNRG